MPKGILQLIAFFTPAESPRILNLGKGRYIFSLITEASAYLLSQPYSTIPYSFCLTNVCKNIQESEPLTTFSEAALATEFAVSDAKIHHNLFCSFIYQLPHQRGPKVNTSSPFPPFVTLINYLYLQAYQPVVMVYPNLGLV